MTSKPVKVGILGFGTVGQGVYRMLSDKPGAIAQRAGAPIEVKAIAVRDIAKVRDVQVDILTTNVDSILDDPEIDVVLELMGGIDPAAAIVERALNSGKSVVTANKELMAKLGSRLVTLAKKNRLDLHYEAAVGGGIPLIQPLKHQLAGNEVVRLMGILNGTTNYILTKMSQDSSQLADALLEAQQQGFAEADPTNDVEGIDSAYKISILASIVFGKQASIDSVYREGIMDLKPDEFRYAKLLGYRIKLLGIVERAGDGVFIRVHPTLVPAHHPLASVEGVYNAVWIHGDFVGDVMFSGRGAGGNPTASAVVGDLIDVVRNMVAQGPGSAIPYGEGLNLLPLDEMKTCYYVRLSVKDQPKVLGAIASEFGAHNVSLSAMEMRVISQEDGIGEIVFLTHLCKEKDFRNALSAVSTGHLAESIEAWLRVEA